MASSLRFLDYVSKADVWAIIEVSSIVPNNVEITNNPSGSNTNGGNGTVTVVYAPSNTLLAPPGYGVDLYDVVFEYPIDANGTVPDAQVRFQIGQQEVSRLVLTAGYQQIMLPRRDRVYGGPERHKPLARSMRWAYNQLAKGNRIANLPLQITGPKIPSQEPLTLLIKSKAGWGQNGTPIRPLRIWLLADMWEDPDLLKFQALYNGAFSITREPSGTVSGVHQLTTTLTSTTIGQLPGGLAQAGGVQIYRKLTVAANQQAIQATAPYVYSNLNAVGGQPNNVLNPRHDLGFAYKGTRNAFIPTDVGLDFDPSLTDGAAAEAVLNYGWWDNDNRTMLPNMHAHGVRVEGHRNRFQWGAAAPQVATDGSLLPLPGADELLDTVVQNVNWALAVTVEGIPGATGFAANLITLALGGTEIVK